MRADDAAPGTGQPSGDLDRLQGDLPRLTRLLGMPELAWLLPRLRSRLESGAALTGTVVRSTATSAERAAAARLAGRPVRAGTSASVSLEALDELLRRSGTWPEGLLSAVVALTGPVADPAEREREREIWREANDILRRLGEEIPSLVAWVDSVSRAGSLRRAASSPANALALADRLNVIGRALPVEGESLAVFAARLAGDAHALDAQTPLGSLAVQLAAHLGGSASGAAPGTARWRRDSWQSVGVVVDELSSTVLTLGLPGGEGSPTSVALASLAAAGQPTILTLRQLVVDDIGRIPDEVFVCENPAVVSAAADRHRSDCAPLVCINGQPGTAAILLLKALVQGGATLRYHGDFDWGGVGIARTLAQHVSWHPWRFDASAYREALDAQLDLPELRGNSGQTPWDPSLAQLMAETGRKVEEEVVLEALLADLTTPQGP